MPRVIAAILLGSAIACLSGTGAAAAGTWRWPVRGAVVAPFRTGPDPFTAGQHRGIDIAAPVRTPVRSACPGRVTFAGFAATAGRTVSVACGRLTASYLHLSSIDVRRGQRVGIGDRLGAVGRSGRPRSAVAHLHFGARWTGRRFAYVDPLSLLGEPGSPPISAVPTRARRATPPGRPPLESASRPLSRVPEPTPAISRRSTPAPRPPVLPWPAWAGLGLVAAAAPTRLVRARRQRRRAAGRATTVAPARLRARP
ncbi:MAG: M23 family metallopeptidase [Solirubrobacteraceae bacterium]